MRQPPLCLAALGLAIALSGCGKIAVDEPDAAEGGADAATDGSTATVTAVTITPPAPEVRVGASVALTAEATLSDGTSRDVTGEAIWSSTDEGIATVDTGTVVGIANGPTTITATYDGKSDEVTVTVVGASCKEILDAGASRGDGVYWIDPNGTSLTQVYCDMTTAGGGWTLTYYVDGERFDGLYANNITSSNVPPTGLNTTNDIWNIETVMSFNETLFGCSQDNEAAIYYWTYSSQDPQIWFDMPAPTPNANYQNNYPSTSSNTTAAGCVAESKDSSYAFMVLESSPACGSCNTMLWGMYHYPSGGGCLNNGTTVLTHTSAYDSRNIYYPVCNGPQVTNGRFWIGVR